MKSKRINKNVLFSLLLSAALSVSGCGTKSTADPGGSSNTQAAGIIASNESGNSSDALTGSAPPWPGGSASARSGYGDSFDDSSIHLLLNGDAVNTSNGASLPDGISFSNGVLAIRTAGEYVLSGTLNGQILVDASSKDSVHLYLNGVTVQCNNSSAIYGRQSDRIIITLVEGTVNSLSDGSSYTYADADETEPNAAIFSKDDLLFNGDGILNVTGNYSDGIRSKDDLFLYSGTYEITAAGDTLQGKDSLEIYSGTYTLSAGKDAVKASNDKDSDKGYLNIYGGSFLLSAGNDAFHAETGLVIEDGIMEIVNCNEGIEGLTVTINSGVIRLFAADDGINAAVSGSSDGSQIDTNAAASITINGGSVYVNAEGDGIDSNGTITVNGGMVYVDGPTDSGNGALDSDLDTVINGGTVIAVGASGMARGFDPSSSQASILYYLGQWMEDGTPLTLADTSGQELLTYTPQKGYDSVVLSCAELTPGESYILSCGSENYTIELSGTVYSNK